MRLAVFAFLAFLGTVLGSAPASAQVVPPGVWHSEDGEITFTLRPNNTYTLSGSPLTEEPLTGRYVVPGSGDRIVVRIAGHAGSMQIDIIDIGDDELVLFSEELLGGLVTFEQGIPVAEILAAPLGAFIGITLILFGGGAVMTGRALGTGWQAWWKGVLYAILLGAADRFLIYGLFDGDLWSIWGFFLHSSILVAITLVTYRLTRARAMVNQYPWLYRRTGPFTWRARTDGA